LNSKLFDKIKVKRRASSAVKPEDDLPRCAWKGCEEAGEHKAPKGTDTPGYYVFCMKHVREYNKGFNFFSEMNDDEIQKIVTDRTGGRPTWDMAANKIGTDTGEDTPRPRTKKKKNHDPSNVFARYNRIQAGNQGPNRSAERKLLEADVKALEMLDVDKNSAPDVIKKAYKDLVKKHHPDINGGDKSSEERLRNIVSAYNHLKSKGFV